jgi:hypothetical protein
MSSAAPRPRFQFSLRDLACLVAGISMWLAVVHYWGPLGVVLTSPLVGLFFLVLGIANRSRAIAVMGAFLFLAGPLVLGIIGSLFR